MTWDLRDPAVRAQLLERLACCLAGKQAFPDPCPWHGEDGRIPRAGDPSKLVDALLHPQRLDVEENVVDKGHEIIGEMPGTQERPPEAPPVHVGERPAGEAALVRSALALASSETTDTVVQEIGLYREHVEKVSETLGLTPHAALKMVLGQIREYMAQSLNWSEAVRALGMESSTAEHVLATVRELHARRVDTDGMVRTATVEELEQQRVRRHAALSDVMTLWGQHRLGEEPPLEDILGLAAWLADGDTAPMVDAIRVRAEVYGQQQAGPDAARWTP